MIRYALRAALVPLTAILLASCSGGFAGTSTPSAAAPDNAAASATQDDAALSTRTALAALESAPTVSTPGRLVLGRQVIHPDAKTPVLIAGFVYAGGPVPGVPCITCVNISNADNVGLPGPNNYVPAGSAWQYGQAFSDVSYVGKCKLSWAIAAGKKVIDSFSAKPFSLSSAGGFVLYALDRNRPKYSGPAVVTSSAVCGPNKVTSSAPLYFQ